MNESFTRNRQWQWPLSSQITQFIVRGMPFICLAVLSMSVLMYWDFVATGFWALVGILVLLIVLLGRTILGNLLGGLFLSMEKRLHTGDHIQVGELIGNLGAIHLLSAELRTENNHLCSVPMLDFLQKPFINFSRSPILRLDMLITVTRQIPAERVLKLLKQVAWDSPQCLREPHPLFLLHATKEKVVEYKLGLWFERIHFPGIQNDVCLLIEQLSNAQDIPIAVRPSGLHSCGGNYQSTS